MTIPRFVFRSAAVTFDMQRPPILASDTMKFDCACCRVILAALSLCEAVGNGGASNY